MIKHTAKTWFLTTLVLTGGIGAHSLAQSTKDSTSVGESQTAPTNAEHTMFPVAYQYDAYPAVTAKVDFKRKIREWDGFGFNYVETAQTRDYGKEPQEYGGFSLLDEKEKDEIIQMVFGEDGLKVGLVKMFLDPHHQATAGGAFDHETSTKYMREFVRKGLQTTRQRGADLQIITTLYGPPAYVTQQKVMRGRDLNPVHAEDLARYLVDWAKFLKEKEKFPVNYVSLHNEGEDWSRWTNEGLTSFRGHDYNMYWSPGLVNEFLKMMPAMLREAGLKETQLTNGETTNWYRFSTWGYADALYDDDEALNNLGMITSHGFYQGTYGKWFGEHKSEGIDLLREKRPELKAWVTSTSWSNMDARNIKEMHGNIYTTKVNGIIPWAGIQRPSMWYEGDPNPGSAFTVKEDGTYEVRRGYHFYKQITRAGQPGMAVVRTTANDSEIAVIAFDNNGTEHPDAFVVINIDDEDRAIRTELYGSESETYRAYRTTEDEKDQYAAIGSFTTENGTISYTAPRGSVTTFFAK